MSLSPEPQHQLEQRVNPLFLEFGPLVDQEDISSLYYQLEHHLRGECNDIILECLGTIKGHIIGSRPATRIMNLVDPDDGTHYQQFFGARTSRYGTSAGFAAKISFPNGRCFHWKPGFDDRDRLSVQRRFAVLERLAQEIEVTTCLPARIDLLTYSYGTKQEIISWGDSSPIPVTLVLLDGDNGEPWRKVREALEPYNRTTFSSIGQFERLFLPTQQSVATRTYEEPERTVIQDNIIYPPTEFTREEATLKQLPQLLPQNAVAVLAYNVKDYVAAHPERFTRSTLGRF